MGLLFIFEYFYFGRVYHKYDTDIMSKIRKVVKNSENKNLE